MQFYSLVQLENEKFNSFYNNVSEIANSCQFGSQDITNRMIRDKIVCGIYDKALQKHLLEQENMSLYIVKNLCLKWEKECDTECTSSSKPTNIEQTGNLIFLEYLLLADIYLRT